MSRLKQDYALYFFIALTFGMQESIASGVLFLIVTSYKELVTQIAILYLGCN